METVILVRIHESVGSGQFQFIIEVGVCSSNQTEEEVYSIVATAITKV
jgi:hypothetical protein